MRSMWIRWSRCRSVSSAGAGDCETCSEGRSGKCAGIYQHSKVFAKVAHPLQRAGLTEASESESAVSQQQHPQV